MPQHMTRSKSVRLSYTASSRKENAAPYFRARWTTCAGKARRVCVRLCVCFCACVCVCVVCVCVCVKEIKHTSERVPARGCNTCTLGQGAHVGAHASTKAHIRARTRLHVHTLITCTSISLGNLGMSMLYLNKTERRASWSLGSIVGSHKNE